MCLRISRRMTAEKGKEVPLNASKRVEIPKRGLSGTGLIDPSVDSMEPPKKID